MLKITAVIFDKLVLLKYVSSNNDLNIDQVQSKYFCIETVQKLQRKNNIVKLLFHNVEKKTKYLVERLLVHVWWTWPPITIAPIPVRV